jgi:methionine synthase reductase
MAKVLYASETGNCEEISRIIHEECVFKGIEAERYCMNQIQTDFNLVPPEVLVIVSSSTGDGDIPANGLKFLRWLRQTKPNLKGIRYAMLGLGDSNYSTYQGAPRTLAKLLNDLGAEEFLPRGEADEQCGLEGVVEPWMQGLYEPLKQEIALMGNAPKRVIESEKVEDVAVIDTFITEGKQVSEQNAVKKILELKISYQSGNYFPGAAVGIIPENDEQDVDHTLGKLNWNGSLVINDKHLISPIIASRIPIPISIKDLFLKGVDLHSPLKTSLATILSHNLSQDSEREDLVSKIDTSKIGMVAPYSLYYVLNQYTSWKEFSIESLLPRLPGLSPRSFSISSSPIKGQSDFSIAISVTGVCTEYLSRALAHTHHSLKVIMPDQPSDFIKKLGGKDRIVMISTGTGISPFKGILEHLTLTTPKPVWLIHGCRQPTRNTDSNNFDFLYKEEVHEYISTLGGQIDIAVSRDPSARYKYIQDIIKDKREQILEWSRDSAFLVCGNFLMDEMRTLLTSINSDIEVVTEQWE